MFSANSIHRPGLLLDWYPEKTSEKPQVVEELSRSFLTIVSSKKLSFGRFGRELKTIAGHSNCFLTVSSDARQHLLRELRADLRRDGVTKNGVLTALGYVVIGVQETLGFTLHDEQLFCAYALMQGLLPEMATGEGKSVCAASAAIVAALSGAPVHVISTNDYLVERDALSMKKLFDYFDLSSSFVSPELSDEQRGLAYSRDICYVSNKQLVFDYLRDRQTLGNQPSPLRSALSPVISPGGKPPLLRGLCFAIVDEADSVLIDDAITPLVLSQKAEGDTEVGQALTAISLAQRLQLKEDFMLDKRTRSASILEQGERRLSDAVRGLDGTWKNRRFRHELTKQALAALHLFERDVDYMIRDGEVLLIDQSTGRVMPDRKLQHGLHQMLEVKERCELSGRSETLSSMSFQTFFRRYLCLCGMTGTAKEAATELRRVYQLGVVSVPSHRPTRRKAVGNQFAENEDQHAEMLLNSVSERQRIGQPVLIGTRSLAQSERLSRLLDERGLQHSVLNARQDKDEAHVVARAGARSAITIATNIAGRGTDIPVLPLIAELGGLHVIVADLNDNARIDRQLIGRCARQGDPGTYEYLLSLSDPMLQRYGKNSVRLLQRIKNTTGERIWRYLCMAACKRAQSVNEKEQRRARQQVASADQQMQKRLAFTGFKE